MEKHLEDKSTAYHNILGAAEENKAIWSSQVEFKSGIDELKLVSGSIDAQSTLQKQDITGIAMDKGDNKTSLIALILVVSGAIQAYASKNRNNELFKKNAYTKSNLTKKRDTEMSGIADLVAATATELGAVLLPFGITAADIAGLESAAKNYRDNFLTKPENAIKDRKTITNKTLPELFEQGDAIVKNILLKLIVQFNMVSPTFVQKFIYNCYIGTKGVRHTRLAILVTQTIKSDSSAPITTPVQNALVVIEDTGLSGNTDAKGKLTITRVPEKATKVQVTFNGITKTSTVEFKRGKATRLDVEFDGAFVMPEAQPVIVPVNA